MDIYRHRNMKTLTFFITLLLATAGHAATFTGFFVGGGAGVTNLNFFTNSQTVFADPNGTNLTGVRGRYDLPFGTVSNAFRAALARDTLELHGTFVSDALVLRVTNVTVNAYGATLINTNFNATGPIPYFRPTGSTVNGLSITNSGDPAQYQASIGWYFLGPSATENALLGSKFVVRDFEGWADYTVGMVSSTNSLFGDWYDCRFHGKAQGFITQGGANNRFYGCLFEALGASVFSEVSEQFTGYAFASDGTHAGATWLDSSGTNQFYNCTFVSKGGGICEALEVEWQSQVYLYGCLLDACADGTTGNSAPDTITTINFIESGNMASLNGCTIRYGGATNLNLAVNMSGSGGVLYLNNTFHYYGMGTTASNGVVCNNDGGTVYVSGGNWTPANFSTPSTVVWMTPRGVGQTNLTTTFTGNGGPVTNLNISVSFMPTNALSTWPTAPQTRGGAAVVNSNATVYILTSTPAGLTWAATNKIAGP